MTTKPRKVTFEKSDITKNITKKSTIVNEDPKLKDNPKSTDKSPSKNEKTNIEKSKSEKKPLKKHEHHLLYIYTEENALSDHIIKLFDGYTNNVNKKTLNVMSNYIDSPYLINDSVKKLISDTGTRRYMSVTHEEENQILTSQKVHIKKLPVLLILQGTDIVSVHYMEDIVVDEFDLFDE